MLFPHEADAQPMIGLGTWTGEVEVKYSRERQETRTPGSPDLASDRLRYNERLGIRNQGFFILDPRLLTGNLGLTWDLFQERERLGGDNSPLHGKLTGYAFDTSLLSENPYSATIFANRSENIFNREFGGRSEFAFENHGASLRLREDSFLRDWGIPYFNATLGVREEHTRESTTLLAQRFTRDETRNIATLDASKGFVNSDLVFRYEQTDVVDQARPQSAFQTRAANLTYSLDFGPTLNRRWNSRVYYLDRTDGNPVTFLTVDEQLRIDHHQDLYTDYRYLLLRNDTQTGATITQTGTFLVHQRLYKNLTTDYMVQGQAQDLPNGERSYYAGQADLNYRRAVTPEHQVFARFGGRYQIDDSAAGRIDVNDETHTAPSPLGLGVGFTLNNPFVDTSTIKVFVDSSRLEAKLTDDYEIVQEGDFTKIVPTTRDVVIHPGASLFVTYAYQVGSDLRFSTATWWLSGGIDFRWIAFSFAHEQQDQTLRSGIDGQFLDDRRTDTAQSELRGDWGSVQARAGATYMTLDSTRLAYSIRRFNQLLTYRPRFDLLLSLSSEQSFTDFRFPQRESVSRLVRLSLDRFTPGGWYASAFYSQRTLDDSLLPDESLREAGLKARRSYGKLDIVPSLSWIDRERGGVATSDKRIEITAIRRF
jgi:hypothetical protein